MYIHTVVDGETLPFYATKTLRKHKVVIWPQFSTPNNPILMQPDLSMMILWLVCHDAIGCWCGHMTDGRCPHWRTRAFKALCYRFWRRRHFASGRAGRPKNKAFFLSFFSGILYLLQQIRTNTVQYFADRQSSVHSIGYVIMAARAHPVPPPFLLHLNSQGGNE